MVESYRIRGDSIASMYCSALACAEQVLEAMIVKDGGSQGGKQTYLLLYRTSFHA